jgi:hypothetical protein
MATPEEIKKELRELDRELAGITDRLNRQRRDGLKVAEDELDRFEAISDQLQQQVSLAEQQGVIQGKTLDSYNKTRDAAEKFAKAQKGLNKGFEKGAGAIQKIQLSIGGITDEFDRFIDRLPGGRTLTRLFGVNDLQENFSNALDESLNTLGESLEAGDSKAKAVAKSIGTFVTELSYAKLAMNGLIALFAAAVASAIALETQFANIAKETGITVTQSEQLVKSSLQMSASEDHRLSTMGDILKVQQATIKEFGNMAMITPEIAAEVASIGEAFGYGAEEAAKVNNVLLGLGVPAAEAADAQRELAAEALKAGVNVGTVTADIATNAKATAKYFNGNVKSLTNAAVEAAKLGVSLATMVKVSDSLLDIESSLANQFEFMALTGKEVNFDLARQLALQGDIAGATKLILDQMGGINEFNQMDVLQKEAAAKAAGMSVDELSKSLAIQAALGNATEDQLAAAQGLGLSAAELQDMSKEDLQNRLEQEQTVARLGKESAQFANELKMALLPLGRDLLHAFETILPVIKLIGEALMLALWPIMTAVDGMKKLIGLFSGSNEKLTIMEGILGSIAAAYLLIQGYAMAVTVAQGLSLVFGKEGLIVAGFRAAKEAFTSKQITLQGAMEKKNLIVSEMLAFISGKKAIAEITAASALTLGLGVAGIIAAIAATVSYMSSATPAGDMFSPADGKTQISTKEGGLFQLSKNDDVMAAPGLASAMSGGGTTSSGGSTDTSRLEGLMSQLITNISALSNRPVQIVIGGRVVDEIKAQADLNSTYVVGAG